MRDTIVRYGWTAKARERLLALRQASGSWGYGKESAPSVEPTALAALALREAEPRVAANASAQLLASQSPDGSVTALASRPEAGWTTAYANLLWAALGAPRAPRESAIAWLLSSKGATLPRQTDGVLGQDPTLIGWPWIDGTASWVEPTALALLALGAEGRLEHPRALAGLAVIRDRAIPGGGWNMGNPVVFGTPLRPLPAPTGLALLALARMVNTREPTVGPAIEYLRKCLPGTRAPASLGWGVLGLRAWRALPDESESWLAEASAQAISRPRAGVGLALLLLAADEPGPSAFGIKGDRNDG